MATYSYDYTLTSLTVSVTGLTAGDWVRVYLRTEPYNGTMFLETAMETVTGTTFDRTYTVRLTAGQEYAVNVEVSGQMLGLAYFTPTDDRPADWSWSGVSSGGMFRDLTGQWDGFTDRINEFRAYQGLKAYDFTPVASGTLLAPCVREVMEAIGEIPGHGTLPNEMRLSAAFFQALAEALNAVG